MYDHVAFSHAQSPETRKRHCDVETRSGGR